MTTQSETEGADLGQDFRLAMRRLASTISIITTMQGGRRIGMAATAVQSVTADPPTLLICVNRTASIAGPLLETGRFAVNLLHVSHADLVPVFSGKVKDEARFASGEWQEVDGLPVLVDAQATLVCRAVEQARMGSHDVHFGRVEQVLLRGEIAPLIYEDGRLVRTVALPVAAE